MATRTPALILATLLTAAQVPGCKSSDPGADGKTAEEYEGDDAGECKDGADNDRDGYFDCQDNGCWGSPDCDGYTGPGGTGPGGPGGPGGTGSGTGTVTGSACVDPPCDLTSLAIDVHMEFDFNGFAELLGLCDCYLDYEGTGAFETWDASLDRLEFYGAWVRVDPGVNGTTPATGTGTGAGTGTGTGAGTGTGIFESCEPGVVDPCKDFVANGIWWTSNPVYHSIFFDNGASPNVITDWITYEFPGGYTPNPNPSNAHQFYITDLFAAYDHAQAAPYSEASIFEQDPGGQFEVVTDWSATFQK